jgi:hypothetical protein
MEVAAPAVADIQAIQVIAMLAPGGGGRIFNSQDQANHPLVW